MPSTGAEPVLLSRLCRLRVDVLVDRLAWDAMGFTGPAAKIDDPASVRTEGPIRIAAVPANALGAGWTTNDTFGFGHALCVLVKNPVL
jgi:hypothetical protein